MQAWQRVSGSSVVVGTISIMGMAGFSPAAEASEAPGMGMVDGAGQTYDNPLLGEAPCLVLNSYEASSNRSDSYDATARVENICGRSVEISFCFPFIEAVDEVDRECLNSVVRPWATATLAVNDLPSKLTGPSYEWRYRQTP